MLSPFLLEIIMAGIQHKDIVDANLHEVKGAVNAANNTWLKANGNGTTSFAALPTATLSITDSITSSLSTDQELPATTETKILLSSGTSPEGAISIASNGTVTLNRTGVYLIRLVANVQGAADVFFRKQVGEMPSVDSQMVTGTSSGNTRMVDSFLHQASAGDTISFFAAPTVAASLKGSNAVAGLPNVPAVSVEVTKIEV